MRSAHDVLFAKVADALTADGAAAPATFLDATNIGVDFASAGAADLVHLQPANEAEREQNRRVKFLAIQFSPQPQVITFGDQDIDRNVA